MNEIRLGSLFDGIGVFPLAAVRCGIVPAWASEIEKAPISITKRHFPGMAHLGDVTKLNGGDIPPVHIITFGSPCQNLSQIGNRAGLAGEKSSLFFLSLIHICTAKYLQEHGVNALRVNKISQESPNVMDLILGHKIDLVIDTPTQGNGDKTRDGFLIRRNAIETGVYCITAMDTANALAHALETASDKKTPVDIATVKNL